jgi:RNA polymerase sigma-70 factor (ECF subfamily)
MPDEPEVTGLLALMLLTEARRPARVAPDGFPVLLPDQDRSLWDRALIAEGHDLVRRCLRRGRPGPYQVQAAIQAVHTDGDVPDWGQVLALYDQLMTLAPSPVVALNRAVAVAEVHGPVAGLVALEGVDVRSHLLPAVRADLLRRLGRDADARAEYDAAIGLAGNARERDLLVRRRDELPGPSS